MTERSARRHGILSRDDLKLWAHVVRGVNPMQGRKAPTLDEAIEAAVAPAPAGRQIAPPPPAPPPLAPVRMPPLDGVERKLRRRLARGQRTVDGVIDLHGLRQAEAHGALIQFVIRAQQQGSAIVLVITGKGGAGGDAYGGERGVLRRMVPHWLGDPALRRYVVGFEQAARGHGGEGSLYVRIRRPRA